MQNPLFYERVGHFIKLVKQETGKVKFSDVGRLLFY
jgi:hypothetical protein